MLTAEVRVTYKKNVSDPQGLTVKHALESLGYRNLKEVRIGKLITVKLDAKNGKAAERDVKKMCRELLANPVVEDYSFEIRSE